MAKWLLSKVSKYFQIVFLFYPFDMMKHAQSKIRLECTRIYIFFTFCIWITVGYLLKKWVWKLWRFYFWGLVLVNHSSNTVFCLHGIVKRLKKPRKWRSACNIRKTFADSRWGYKKTLCHEIPCSVIKKVCAFLCISFSYVHEYLLTKSK